MSDEFILSEAEAKVVGKALAYFNNYLVGEFDKIKETENVSALVVSAAQVQYQELSLENTTLHMRLADHFPVLRQR